MVRWKTVSQSPQQLQRQWTSTRQSIQNESGAGVIQRRTPNISFTSVSQREHRHHWWKDFKIQHMPCRFTSRLSPIWRPSPDYMETHRTHTPPVHTRGVATHHGRNGLNRVKEAKTTVRRPFSAYLTTNSTDASNHCARDTFRPVTFHARSGSIHQVTSRPTLNQSKSDPGTNVRDRLQLLE